MAEEVSLWLKRFLDGDQAAAQPLWDQYYAPLMQVARRKMGHRPCRTTDEEDVALSAFHSFCRAATAGRFPQLEDREDLWRLLVTITHRKVVGAMRRQFAQKRGGGVVRGESYFQPGPSSDSPSENVFGLASVPDEQLTPAVLAMMQEACEGLLNSLEDDTLRQVALRKLEGLSNEEAARDLGCSVATIERKLSRIRKHWSQLATATSDVEPG